MIKLNPFQRHSEFDATTMVDITDSGKQALDEQMVTSIKSSAILSALDEHSPRSLQDLSKASQMNIFTSRNEVSKLKKQHYIRILED